MPAGVPFAGCLSQNILSSADFTLRQVHPGVQMLHDALHVPAWLNATGCAGELFQARCGSCGGT